MSSFCAEARSAHGMLRHAAQLLIDMTGQPNILYFQVDNLGFGELSCYPAGHSAALLQLESTNSRRQAFASPTIVRSRSAHPHALRFSPVGTPSGRELTLFR
jgi:hypothetical protein